MSLASPATPGAILHDVLGCVLSILLPDGVEECCGLASPSWAQAQQHIRAFPPISHCLSEMGREKAPTFKTGINSGFSMFCKLSGESEMTVTAANVNSVGGVQHHGQLTMLNTSDPSFGIMERHPKNSVCSKWVPFYAETHVSTLYYFQAWSMAPEGHTSSQKHGVPRSFGQSLETFQLSQC